MSEESHDFEFYGGTLLVASPELLDPNFRQTLIYLARHDEEGALGLIMNRPLGRTLGEIAKGPEVTPALTEVPVYLGGPVQPNALLLAVFQPGASKEKLTCRLDVNAEQVEAIQANETAWVRAFVGYSGWGEGQLENEMSTHSWCIRNPDPILFEEKVAFGLWSVYISGDDRWRRLLPFLPKDPEVN